MRPVFFFPCATILDCGASRTTLAVFSGGGKGRLRLEQIAAAPLALEPGQEANWLAKTTEVLPSLRAQLKPAGPVTVILPPHLTLMKMLSTPRVDASKRDKIINFESQQSIPYPLAEVAWDRVIAGESPQIFNVLLCAAKLDVLDPLCAAVAAAGFTPSILLPSARALAAFCRELPPDPAAPVLLIGLGARSTTLVLSDQNSYQARSLALGGLGVTQQIAEAQGGDFAQAEKLKHDSSRAAEINPVVRVFANRLAQEIGRTLGYFHRPISAENPLRILLTGGGAGLPGLAGLLATQLNVPVALADVASAIEVGRDGRDCPENFGGSTMADLIGGAALQLRTASSSLNLLPPRLRQQAGRRKLRPWLAVAAGLAVAALTPAVVHYDRAHLAARARSAALERELVPLRLADAHDRERRQRRAELQRQQDAWRKIEEARSGWLQLLGEIQARFAACDGVWLERMRVVTTAGESESVHSDARPALRIAFSGLLRPKPVTTPEADEEKYQRVKLLLEHMAKAPPVAAVEGERFEALASGLLRFDFVLVIKPTGAL